MTFEYLCEKCGAVVQGEFPVGKAKKTMPCTNEECKEAACERYYGNYDANIVFKGGGWAGKTSKLNREMNHKQDKAGQAQEGTWRGSVPKLKQQ